MCMYFEPIHTIRTSYNQIKRSKKIQFIFGMYLYVSVCICIYCMYEVCNSMYCEHLCWGSACLCFFYHFFPVGCVECKWVYLLYHSQRIWESKYNSFFHFFICEQHNQWAKSWPMCWCKTACLQITSTCPYQHSSSDGPVLKALLALRKCTTTLQ